MEHKKLPGCRRNGLMRVCVCVSRQFSSHILKVRPLTVHTHAYRFLAAFVILRFGRPPAGHRNTKDVRLRAHIINNKPRAVSHTNSARFTRTCVVRLPPTPPPQNDQMYAAGTRVAAFYDKLSTLKLPICLTDAARARPDRYADFICTRHL